VVVRECPLGGGVGVHGAKCRILCVTMVWYLKQDISEACSIVVLKVRSMCDCVSRLCAS
jgi:hypothetical protein